MATYLQNQRVRPSWLFALTLLQLLYFPAFSQATPVIAVDHRVTVTYSQPRFDPQQGTYSIQVQIKNHSAAPLLAPLRLNVNHIEDQVIKPLNATGLGADDQPYIEFALSQGKLGAGKTTAAVTLTYKTETDQAKHKAHQQRRKKHNNNRGQVTAGVKQAPIGLHATPYALVAGGSPLDVRFSVHLLEKNTEPNTPLVPVFLRNTSSGETYPMHDHGRRVNVVNLTIDPSKMAAETCMSFEAYIFTAGIEVVSPAYKLCASKLPISLAIPNTSNPTVFTDGTKAVSDEILLTATSTASTAAIEQIAKSINAKIVGGDLNLNLYQLKLSAPNNANQLIETINQLKLRPEVFSASVNALGSYSSTPSDTEFSSQHGLQLIRAHDVWDANAKGNGITTVVLDLGIDRTHPDWGTSPGNCQIAENDLEANNCGLSSTDTVGHGTQVAGVIAARADNAAGVAGVAPDSKVHSIKISSGTTFAATQMITGFNEAITYMATRPEARIINASFSAPVGAGTAAQWNNLCTLIDQTVYNGAARAVVINSVGNLDANGTLYPPRCNDLNSNLDPSRKNLLITVANSTSISTPDCGSVAIDQRCANSIDGTMLGSNYGSWVDIAAPGSSIRTTTLGGGYASPTGTSFSAPMVSGAAAILLSCGVPLNEIESTLRTSANVTVAFPDATSAPRLDIYRALISRNRAPTAIALSNNSLSNGTNTSSAYEVGTLLATDLDTCDKFTYSIVGGADAAKFSIGGTNSDRLRISDGVLNSSVKSSYTVTVRVTDFAGQTVDSTHVVTVTVPQCADGIDNDGDGKIDYPADPGCSSASDTSENTNALPTAPVLVSPANNSINVNGASVTFKWNRATDPDGDTVSYQFYLCKNAAFTACGPVLVASNSLSATQLAGLLGGGLGGSGFLLAGLMGARSPRRPLSRKKMAVMMFAATMALTLLVACGGGGGSGGGGTPGGSNGGSTNVTRTETLLTGSTQYHWKVVAEDGNGGSTSSAVYTFTTH